VEYLPLSFQLTEANVLLVGGTEIAVRKARLLLRANARLTVVALDISQEMEALIESSGVTWQRRNYSQQDLEHKVLVVVACDDIGLAETIFKQAKERALPINVVDAPDLCTVIFPAIIDRSPLTIAISSSGSSPVLTRILKRKFEAMVPGAYGELARFAGRMRDVVKASVPDDSQRRSFWESVLEGAPAELLMAGRENEAEKLLTQRLASENFAKHGEVYLVGAGPGDPDLLTFKAARLLQSADVVLYDRLVSEPILDVARKDAQRIYVGKRRAQHSVPQPEINQLLVDLALQGLRVVRLKGGDPFIFGRGGEEIDLLVQHNIPFQVVPGITAASGAACYGGIPLTHRDYAQSVRFVAGHLKEGELNHDWEQFQSTNETLVFYMGLNGLPQICSQLMAHGRSADTPMALIEHGTLPDQRVLTATLSTMEALVAAEKPRAPTLLIVGDVVRLHHDLAWFGRR